MADTKKDSKKSGTPGKVEQEIKTCDCGCGCVPSIKE